MVTKAHSKKVSDTDQKMSILEWNQPLGYNNIPGKKVGTMVPESVNYHFTRRCNYECKFCFHTSKTSSVLPLEEAQRGLRLLSDAGMKKINFSGGEPFLHAKFLGELVQYCKAELHLQSVSVVCNGSMVRKSWFDKYGEYLDIMAISVDSFDELTNEEIGRKVKGKRHLHGLHNVHAWCEQFHVAFKLNTVVCKANLGENMAANILELKPVRWKVFQCLPIEGENVGDDALRDGTHLFVTDDEFQSFVDRHGDVHCMVPESNQNMRDSYFILDEYMRFLDCTQGRKDPSPSILDVGVFAAITRSGFDEDAFKRRGGKYVWSKADMNLEW